MIYKALSFIHKEIDDHIIRKRGITSGNAVVLHNVVTPDSGATVDPIDNSTLLSLIHIEEERIFKGQETYFQPGRNGRSVRTEPELRFNLYVLFTAKYEGGTHYTSGLMALDDIISFFQAQHVFDASTHPNLDAELGRMVMEVYTQPLEKSYEFWQSLGGKFYPSVMYKLRVIRFQENLAQSNNPVISSTSLNADTVIQP